MSTITYVETGGEVRVYSGRLRIGTIKQASIYGGYLYQPKGSKAVGEVFATVAEVKRSLED